MRSSHDLARLILEYPDMPCVVKAPGFTSCYLSADFIVRGGFIVNEGTDDEEALLKEPEQKSRSTKIMVIE